MFVFFVEHFSIWNVLWKGNNGSIYFLENELPYYVENFENPAVEIRGQNFFGLSMGVYCNFENAPINLKVGIRSIYSATMINTYSVFENGNQNSGIQNVLQIGDSFYGLPVNSTNTGPSFVCNVSDS